MRNKHTHAREVFFSEAPPERFVEAGNTIVGIGGGFSVGDPVEEVTVVGTLLPHAAHFGGAGLEVSEILFAQAGFFVDFYGVTGERRRGGGGGGEGIEYSFGGFTGSTVGRCEEVECVVGAEKGAQFYTCFFCLGREVSVFV